MYLCYRARSTVGTVLYCTVLFQSTEHCRYYTGDKFYLNAIPTLCCLVLLLGVGGYITWVHFPPPGPAYQAHQPQLS